MSIPLTIEELYSYQQQDLAWFIEHPLSMLLYEPRMGKTVVSSFIMSRAPGLEVALVICPKNALSSWRDHIEPIYKAHWPEKSVEVRLVMGKEADRWKLWTKPCTCDLTVFVITYGIFDQDIETLYDKPSMKKLGFTFDAIFADEVHKRFKNRKNKSLDRLATLMKVHNVPRLHPMSGTMTSKAGPIDFWAMLNVLNRKVFSSYWRFAYQFSEIIENGFGKEIIGPKNVQQFHKILDFYARRRFRAIERPDMPKVQRQVISVNMTNKQEFLIDALGEDSFVWAGDQLIVATTSLETSLRRRQILACPAVFDPTLGEGAAFDDFLTRIMGDKDSEQKVLHCVLFTNFASALPFFEKRLRKEGIDDVFVLRGGMALEEMDECIQKYKDTQGVMLCSIQYAQAFSLAPAQECYFIGYSWDPNDNVQAEDRLVPQTGDYTITAYYYGYNHTSDKEVARAMDSKSRSISLTMGSAKIFQDPPVEI